MQTIELERDRGIPVGRCSTGDPDKGGTCTSCVQYRNLRRQARAKRGY